MSTVPYRREAAMCLLACRRYANEHDTTRGVAGTGRSRGHPGAVARPPGRRRVVGVGGPRWLGRRVAVRRRRRPVRAPGRDRRLLRAPATGHPLSLPSGADGTASDAPRYRVVQWATGNIGTYALRAVVEHPRYDLAGAYVYSPAKAGRDAGELCGLDPVGVVATDDIEEIVGLGADCVLYMPAKCDFDEVCRLLESGANIVTTRGEFHRAESLDPAARERVEAACARGRTSIHSTGSSPGFISEALHTVEIAAGKLEAGSVAAQRLTVAGMRGGRPLLRFRAIWYCSTDLDPAWDLLPTGWRVTVDGDAPLDIDMRFPIPPERMAATTPAYTANPAVNAVPVVCA